MSARDTRAHLEEVYGLRVSADLISRVTNAILAEVSDWGVLNHAGMQNQPD